VSTALSVSVDLYPDIYCAILGKNCSQGVYPIHSLNLWLIKDDRLLNKS